MKWVTLRLKYSIIFRYDVTSRPSRPIHVMHFPFTSKYSFHLWDMYAFFDEIEYWMEGKTPAESDRVFRRLLQTNVMSFIYTGKPLASQWEEYPTTALISDTLLYSDYHKQEKCDFWLSSGFFNFSWVL